MKREIPVADVWVWTAVLLIGLAGAGLILYSTAYSPWAFSDSTVYISVARNFIAGRGFGLIYPSGDFSPLYHYPPLYPLVLSALGAAGLDLLDAARLLDVILFSSLIVILAGVFYTVTRSIWLTILIALSILLLPELLEILSGVMSEPLSLFLGTAGLVLLAVHIERRRASLLVASALLLSLAALTRYVAVAYLITGAGMLLLLHRRAWKQRLPDLIIYMITGIIPIAIWLVWLDQQQNLGARVLNPSRHFWTDLVPLRMNLVSIVWSWIPFSNQFPSLAYNDQKNILLLAAIVALAIFTLSLLRMKRRDPAGHMQDRSILLHAVLAVFIASYLAVLVLAYAFTHPRPDIDARMLLPVQIAVILLLIALVSYISRAWSDLKWPKLLNVLPLVLLVSFLPTSRDILQEYHRDGHGYTSKHWQLSETIQAVRKLPPQLTLISNEAAVLLLYTGRPAYEIPELIYSESLSEFSRYGDNNNDPAQNLFRENKAALILFDNIYYQFERLDGGHPQERLDAFIQGLKVYGDYADGTIYFYTVPTP